MRPRHAEWLQTKGVADTGGRTLPKWTAASALSMMDEIGTATGILSVSAPGTGPAVDESEAVRIAREVNDFGAVLQVAPNPDGSRTPPGYVRTAIDVVNTIPAVCDAEPGIITDFELGLVRPRGIVGTAGAPTPR